MKTLMNIPAVRTRGTWRGWRWLLVGLAVLVGLPLPFVLAAASVDYPLVTTAPPEGTPRQVRGAFHVHTTRSDGRGDVEEVALAAKAAGLDFVVLTDHNLEQLPAPEWRHGVLLVPAVELSTQDGHVVALGLAQGLNAAQRAKDALGRIAMLGGASVLAHPVQSRNPWRDWSSAARHARGFELYSADTMLRGALSHPGKVFLPGVLGYLGNPMHGLLTWVKAEPGAHERLLSLSARKPRPVLCSVDAHGIPPYEQVFQSMAMVLPLEALSKDAVLASSQVLSTLVGGEALCVFSALGDAAGFRMEGLGPAGRTAEVGEGIRVVLPAATPPEVRLQLYGPARLQDDRTVVLEGPGAVQIEVWVRVPRLLGEEGWRPWIVPSPIRVVAASGPDGSAMRE